ncbi:hypothetical protein, partial [Enterococcus faecalis]|uniref:hypothetical protein n=1 Tax=Enterococcus faecalis TaxID=1351 RepID=UPI00403F89C4
MTIAQPLLTPAHRTARWHPGVATGCAHTELFASGKDAAGAALALAMAAREACAPDDHRPFLWVQDAGAIRLS